MVAEVEVGLGPERLKNMSRERSAMIAVLQALAPCLEATVTSSVLDRGSEIVFSITL